MAFKIKETILGVGIAIIFVMFVGYGISTFYKEPKFEDFCDKGDLMEYVYSDGYYREAYPIKAGTEDNVCADAIENYEALRKQCADEEKDMIYTIDSNGCRVAKECTSCNQDFKNKNDIYNRNVFIITGIIGIVVIILGIYLHLTSVSSGLFGGGIMSIIYGTGRYWSELADYARFIILGIALGVLIYLGYKKFNKK